MVLEGDKAYNADGNYKGTLAFVKEGDEIYNADGNYKGKLAAVIEGLVSRAIVFVLLKN